MPLSVPRSRSAASPMSGVAGLLGGTVVGAGEDVTVGETVVSGAGVVSGSGRVVVAGVVSGSGRVVVAGVVSGSGRVVDAGVGPLSRVVAQGASARVLGCHSSHSGNTVVGSGSGTDVDSGADVGTGSGSLCRVMAPRARVLTFRVVAPGASART